MGETTTIGWTDHTFNPWWGCTKIEGPNGTGSACDRCYAERDAKRYGHDVWGKDAPRRFLSDANWAKPLKWNAAAAAGEPGPNTGLVGTHLVFCASMADVFEARDDLDEPRARLWDLIAATPHLTWLLLTKRPEQVLRRTPWAWRVGQHSSPPHPEDPANWPANVWVGTTVEDQARADLRIPRLLEIPAPVRFLSIEPLLGPLRLSEAATGACDCLVPTLDGDGQHSPSCPVFRRRVDWVIVGGESGPGHRPLDLVQAGSLRDQCASARVPFFFKQVGGLRPTDGGDELDGRRHKEFPKAASR